MKRIFFSSYDDIRNPYYGGGGAYAIHEIAKGLAAKNEVTVLTGKYPGCSNNIIDGVRYKRVATSFFGARLGQLLFLFCIPWYVLNEKFDIWFESFTPPFSTACLQLFTKKPVVGVVHLFGGEEMFRKYHIPFHFIERIGLQTYHNVIVLTDFFKKKIQNINPKIQVHVIPNGVRQEVIFKGFQKTPKHFLFIGRLEKNQKGLDFLIEILKRTLNKISIPVLIAGTGPDEKWLQDELIKNDLERKVKLLGRIGGQQKIDALKDGVATLFTSRYEAQPLVLFESFTYKTPVIFFDIEQLSWLPDNVGVKVDAYNISTFSAAMVSLANDPFLVQKLGNRAQEFAKAFSWDNSVREYEKIVKKLC